MHKVLTADRRLVSIKLTGSAWDNFKERFHLVRTHDGPWIPRCDLAQYEIGNRKAI